MFLNQDLVDFSKPIVVETNGMKSFDGIIESNIEILLQEARHRSGAHRLFPAKLTIDVLPSSTVDENHMGVSRLRVAEFFLQPVDQVRYEIAISPADAVCHLPHLR